MKKYLMTILISLFVFSSVYAEGPKITFDAALNYVWGDTTYNISFGEYYPAFDLYLDGESELEFEINATMAIFNVQIDFNDMFRIILEYGETIAEHGGTLRDRDWIYIYDDWWDRNYYINPLMGDTDSDVDSQGQVYDVTLAINSPWFKNMFFDLGFRTGYKMQKWGTFVAKNIQGYYEDLLTDSGRRLYVNETYATSVLTYDVEYHIFYIGVDLGFDLKNFYLGGSFIFGLAYAEDEDDHVLRMKKSDSEADGISMETRFNAEWVISEIFSITVYSNFLYIYTEGEQDQYWYDDNGYIYDSIEDIDTEISSSQYNLGIKATFRF